VGFGVCGLVFGVWFLGFRGSGPGSRIEGGLGLLFEGVGLEPSLRFSSQV